MRNHGAVGDAAVKITQTQPKIAETELQIGQIEHDFVADVVKQLRETETRIGDLREKKIAVEDKLRLLEVRAPLSGIVHLLAVHTIGGVVSPSDVLMHIAPACMSLPWRHRPPRDRCL
jgi:HlyD family secretion protein